MDTSSDSKFMIGFAEEALSFLRPAASVSSTGLLDFQAKLSLLFNKGWVVEPTSCECGGRFAWLKPRESGALEMVGCVCHNTNRILNEI